MNTREFENGLSPDEYVEVLGEHRSLVRKLMPQARPNPDHVGLLEEVADRLPGEVRATIMTEDWCGDSACNLPVLASLFASAGIELRILRGSEHPRLKAHMESESSDHRPTRHIPVLSIWDNEFNELVRWVEAPDAVTEKKDEWKFKRPRYMELYRRRAEDPEAAKEYEKLRHEFLETMGAWYAGGCWEETTREIAEAASAAVRQRASS